MGGFEHQYGLAEIALGFASDMDGEGIREGNLFLSGDGL
jgi:hypothetical protein